MSQQDIIEFLAENPKEWYCCRDIATFLEETYNKVSRQLCKLRKYEEVKCKKDTIGNQQKWIYQYKR